MSEVYNCPTKRGNFIVRIADDRLKSLSFPGQSLMNHSVLIGHTLIDALSKDLDKYFEGHQIDWSWYPIDIDDAAVFQKRVWSALCDIPYGQVVSYMELAHAMGNRAARAVGNACGRNRLPIIIPCHRVIRADRSIGGFTSGPAWKKFLLRCEGFSVDTKN